MIFTELYSLAGAGNAGAAKLQALCHLMHDHIFGGDDFDGPGEPRANFGAGPRPTPAADKIAPLLEELSDRQEPARRRQPAAARRGSVQTDQVPHGR